MKMRFDIKRAAVNTEHYEKDRIIALDVSLIIRDSFTGATYSTSVEVGGEELSEVDEES